MKSLIAATLTLLAAAGPAFAQAKLVPARSEIAFTSKQMGVPVDGRFRKFDAQVTFDPKAPAAAAIALTIDLASVALGAAEVETEVAKPDWFDTARFPQATFRSTAVRAAGPGRFEVAGKLAIKGASRDVVVPVALAQAGGDTSATGAFAIKRLDFRIGDGDWKDTSMVADDVQVKFKLVLTGIGAL
jgi:polyisoprenoid-binding protein YceI